jgi:hypothetical protein
MLNLTFFSQKMLIQLFSEKCWFNIFVENVKHFIKNVETFSNARAGGKIKGRLFRWAFVGWKFTSLSTFR